MPDQQKKPKPENLSEFISDEAKGEEGNYASNTKFTPNKDRIVDEREYLLIGQLITSLTQNREQRITYARRTFWLTVVWIASALVILVLSGIRYKCEKILLLSDTVIITLITTTTVNVFAFFILVMQFLFNKEEFKALTYLQEKKSEKAIPKDEG